MPQAGSRAGAPTSSTDHLLLDALLALVAEPDLPGVLQRIVSASCALTAAGGGVLAVARPDGGVGERVTHGVDETEAGELLASSPGPDGRPGGPVLGVPVLVRGEEFGSLHLSGKPGGAPFDDADASLVAALTEAAGAMIGHAHTFRRSERDRVWLAAAADVGDALQSGDGGWDRIADAARRAAGTRWALVVQPEGDRYDAVAFAGDGVPASAVLHDVDEALRRADAAGEAATARHGDEPVLVVPLPTRLADRSVLLLAWAPGGRGPDAEEITRIVGFAESAALALDRSQALAERQELMLVADRDRIARDLHDLVIQRLFATGLQLQGVRQMATSDGVRSRVDEAVADLDLTIRDIRSTIFELQHQRDASLRAEVRALVKDYVPVLGFTPLVRTTGPIESLPPNTADQLLATLREGLSNVARHAGADACVVEVRLLGGWLTLVVADNGIGMPADPHESGLRNVRRRAAETGGRLRLQPEEPRGARLEWTVPAEPGVG